MGGKGRKGWEGASKTQDIHWGEEKTFMHVNAQRTDVDSKIIFIRLIDRMDSMRGKLRNLQLALRHQYRIRALTRACLGL